MDQRADVLVLGGGVIGLTAAYFLAREGARVHLIDQGDFGRESSWAGAGILPPGDPERARTPFDRLRARSAVLFPSLSAELRERTGIDNGYLRCGGLEFTGAHSEAAAEEWCGEGVEAEALDEPAALRLEPTLARGLGPALHLPGMGQLRNPRHLKALIAGCAGLGVRLTPGCAALALERRGERLLSVQTSSGRIEAGRYLVAAGAWSGPLLEQAGCRLPVRPVRGQIAMLNTGVPLLRRVLMWGARYLVPRPDGRVLVGSTEEDAGFDRRTTASAIAELIILASRLVPRLGEAHLERCWAGLRPGSPDGLPYLGRVPGCENLFVAAGHYRAGIQLSPATAQALTELILNRPPTVPLEPFRLDRAT